MDQQGPKPFKEEILEVRAEVNTEKQEESLEEDQSFQDYLIPQPAFEIDLNDQNLTEEQREAICYILSVRNQKQSLVSNKMIKKSQNQQKIQAYQLNNQIGGQKATKEAAEDEVDVIESKISQWKIEHVSNWRCVVSNIQFINKQKKPIELHSYKLKEEILFEQPQVHNITKNKWLNLPQIQEFIIDLSNYYCQILQENQHTQTQKHYYHVWIYSLLALHQSYASYTNFEALASVNACIELQFRTHLKNISTNNSLSSRLSLQNSIIQWLTTVMILKQVFKQHFLRKYLVLLRKMQML